MIVCDNFVNFFLDRATKMSYGCEAKIGKFPVAVKHILKTTPKGSLRDKAHSEKEEAL
jgi:hypothetical protein